MATYVAKHGITVHEPDIQADFEAKNYGTDGRLSQFEGRRSILWDPDKRHLYVSGPNWLHPDTRKHFDRVGQPVSQYADEGYVAGGPAWGNGELKWFMNHPEEHTQIADALEEVGIPVPNKEREEPDPDKVPLWMRPDAAWGNDDDEHEEAPDLPWENDEND